MVHKVGTCRNPWKSRELTPQEFLTVFAFSTENWKRDPQEVQASVRFADAPRAMTGHGLAIHAQWELSIEAL